MNQTDSDNPSGRVDVAPDAVRRSVVPEFLPADRAMPDEPLHIPFWKAFLLHGIRPEYGPHLVAGPLRSAIAAHYLSLALTIVFACITYVLAYYESDGSVMAIRERLALLIIEAMYSTEVGGESSRLILFCILAAPVIATVAFVLFGLLLAPVAAGGDGLWSACKRSVKDALWASTVLMWIGAFCLVAVVIQRVAGRDPAATGVMTVTEMIFHDASLVGVLVVVAIVLIIRAIQSGTIRYVGPSVGPGFEPRRPTCEDCGYLIGGLPVESRCPECGLDVRTSLPGGRRSALAMDAKKLSFLHPVAYTRFWWEVLTTHRVGRRLPLRDIRLARRFWWIGYAYGLLGAIGTLILAAALGPGLVGALPVEIVLMLNSLIVASPALVVLMHSAACIVGRVAFGIRDPRVCMAVVYYATVALGPIGVMILVQSLVMFSPTIRDGRLALPWDTIDVLVLPSVVTTFVSLVFFCLWIVRTVSGLRAARSANS